MRILYLPTFCFFVQINVFCQLRVTRNAMRFAASSVPCMEGFVGSVSYGSSALLSFWLSRVWNCKENCTSWSGLLGAEGGRRNVCELQTVCCIEPMFLWHQLPHSCLASGRMMPVFRVSCVASSASFPKQANHTVELQPLAGKTGPELCGRASRSLPVQPWGKLVGAPALRAPLRAHCLEQRFSPSAAH